MGLYPTGVLRYRRVKSIKIIWEIDKKKNVQRYAKNLPTSSDAYKIIKKEGTVSDVPNKGTT